MAYIIQRKQRDAAKRLGVVIVPSKDPEKKLDVYKDGKKVASVGATGYNDYYLYLKGEKSGKYPKGYAAERRRLYKIRHAKDRRVYGSNGFYADKLLW